MIFFSFLLLSVHFFFFFFFFQAEDGIRDLTVTGVQTCALPISSELLTPLAMAAISDADWKPLQYPIYSLYVTSTNKTGGPELFNHCLTLTEQLRSEERRVGKECRSRWSQYHEKYKKKI